MCQHTDCTRFYYTRVREDGYRDKPQGRISGKGYKRIKSAIKNAVIRSNYPYTLEGETMEVVAMNCMGNEEVVVVMSMRLGRFW